MSTRKSVDDTNIFTGYWDFNWKRNIYCNISKFKKNYCGRGYIHKGIPIEPLNNYYQVVHCYMVRLIFILKCIICFKSQSIYFKNDFDQADITIQGKVFI